MKAKIPLTVETVLRKYPPAARVKVSEIRQMLLDIAGEESLQDFTETLKWGEPSYLAKKASTVRLAWREKAPDEVGVFFNCQSSLVETFREIYGDTFHYEGNRALLFATNKSLPEQELKHCLTLAMTYHTRKKLPLLGA